MTVFKKKAMTQRRTASKKKVTSFDVFEVSLGESGQPTTTTAVESVESMDNASFC